MVSTMDFEILEKDLMGRIGRLKTRHGTIITPELAPVVNPVHNLVKPSNICDIGFKILMTNSYIILKRYGEIGKELGVHRLLGVDCPVMTDSGAYQLMIYGSVDVTPEEIIRYQEDIDSDIGVILDIPTKYDSPRNVVEREVRETLRRARISLEIRSREDMLLVGPVQGGRYLDLVEYSASELASLDFDVYGIGGPTQIMEQYKYDELVELIATAKKALPCEKPVHLFGAGNPMMLPFAVALGVDLFDSASYALYAKDLRYMLNNRVIRFDRLSTLPCSCPICSKSDINEWRELPRSELIEKIAVHNLYIIKAELKKIRQAIHEGTLWELMEARARAHPALLNCLYNLTRYFELLEKYDPIIGNIVKGIFTYGEISVWRPEIVRHKKRLLENYQLPTTDVLILMPETEIKPFFRIGPISQIYNILIEKGLKRFEIVIYCSPFGVVPIELDEVYPLSQYERQKRLTDIEKEHVINIIMDFLIANRERFRRLIIVKDPETWGKKFYDRLTEKLAKININMIEIDTELGVTPYTDAERLAEKIITGITRKIT